MVFQRLIREALSGGWAARQHVVGKGDEELIETLDNLAAASDSESARRARERLLPAIRNRRLPKRAAEWSGDSLAEGLARLGREVAPWLHERPDLRAALEDHLAGELGLEPGSLFLDYPAKARMLELKKRSGQPAPR